MSRKRLPVLVAVVLFLLAAAAGTASATGSLRHGPLRVMSYNIHAGIGTDGAIDLDRLAAQIDAADPDLVGLQEVDRHWSARSAFADEPAELARRTGMHYFFAPIYSLAPPRPGAPRREYGTAVLSRSPILAARNHEITRLSTQEPNPRPAPAPGFAEVFTVAHGQPVRFYTTHLDYRRDPAIRTAQVADTLRIMRPDRPGVPQVLSGDFNAAPDAAELAPLRRDLDDAWTGPGGETYPAAAPTARLDQVLVSPRLDVDGARVPDTLASDHRPVVVALH